MANDLTTARDIIRRLLDVVNAHNEYDEHTCPNGQPACATCRLVAEAKAFVCDANEESALRSYAEWLDKTWEWIKDSYGDQPLAHQEFARVVAERTAGRLMKELTAWAEARACIRLRDKDGKAIWRSTD